MPLNDPLLNIGVTAMQAAAGFLSLHSAQPNATGSNETTAGRVAAGWPAAANGDFGALSNKTFTGGTPGGAVTHVGFQSASTGGTFYGWLSLTGDNVFNSAGEYVLTSTSIPGTAT